MKILQVTTESITIKSFLLSIPLVLRRHTFDCAAANILKYDSIQESYSTLFNISFSRSVWDFLSHFKAVIEIRKLIISCDYDVVHVHTPIAAFLVRFALWRHRKKQLIYVVYTAHGFHFYRGGFFLKNWMYLFLEKLAGLWTDKLIVINSEDYRSAIRYRIVPPDNVTFMPGIGVDIKKYSSNRSECDLMSSLGLSPSCKVFLMVAELVPQKNHKKVMDAFKEIKTKNAVLLCAGQGPMYHKLMLYSKKINIESKVKFLGFRTDIDQLLALSTGLILFSKREGLPRSTLEAYAAGVPVIAPNIRGINDLLSKGGGMLVDNHSVNQLRDYIDILANDLHLRKKLSLQAKNIVNDYSIENVLNLHEVLYSEIESDLLKTY